MKTIAEVRGQLNEHEQEVLDRLIAQMAYRKAYNKRPEVREKRREYNRERWQEMKEIRAKVAVLANS